MNKRERERENIVVAYVRSPRAPPSCMRGMAKGGWERGR